MGVINLVLWLEIIFFHHLCFYLRLSRRFCVFGSSKNKDIISEVFNQLLINKTLVQLLQKTEDRILLSN